MPLSRLPGSLGDSWQTVIVIVVCTASFFLNASTGIPALTDEYDIISPALQYMTGEIALDLLLFFFLMRRLCTKTWALLSVLLLITVPVIPQTAIMVKTEALQICELLVVLIALQRVIENRHDSRWHAVAAVGAALSLTTKVNPLPLLLYFVVSATTFLQWTAKVGLSKSKVINRLVATALVMTAVGQMAYFLVIVPAVSESLTRHMVIMERYQNRHDFMMVVFPTSEVTQSAAAEGTEIREEPLRDRVARRRPTYLYVFSAYIVNMCKYEDSVVYWDNCEYFDELLEGETEYALASENQVDIPGREWLPDPELRTLAFYLFRRKGAGGFAPE